jgi:hypothetical protein
MGAGAKPLNAVVFSREADGEEWRYDKSTRPMSGNHIVFAQKNAYPCRQLTTERVGDVASCGGVMSKGRKP